MSIFEGKLDEIREISIDMFLGPENLKSTAYFLSHCHSDHMHGLSRNDFYDALFNRDDVYLYTSEISRCILKNDKKYRHLVAKIKTLTVNQSAILTIPSCTDDIAPKEISVTFIPAGHCPGSVMFLFELKEGNVLYTGDFRYSVGSISRIPVLHHIDGTPKEIDACYLDATFFDKLYPSFPSREESLNKICELITEWLNISPENEIFLDRPARYGYEHVYVGIKDRLGMQIHIEDDIFFKYRNVFEIGAGLTNKSCETKIHACGLKAYGGILPCKKANIKLQTIRFSCSWYRKEYEMKGEMLNVCPNYVRVCYACHCSYSELVYFLTYLSPKKTIACAVPLGKSKEEAEKEIAELLKSSKRKRPSLTDDSDDDVSLALKGQSMRKVLSTPRKKRPFVKASLGLSSDDSWSKGSSAEVINQALENQIDINPSTSGLDKTSQNFEINGSLMESDNDLSPSLLPQYSPKVIDPIACTYSSDCLIIKEGQHMEKEIEIITLSSDESPEIFAMD